MRGPKDLEGRRCTDCCCLCLFLTFWVGLCAIATIVMSAGDISNIVYGSDYLGNRCGTPEGHNKKKLWFPRISQDVYEQSSALVGKAPWEVHLYGLCVDECPQETGREIPDYGWRQSDSAKARSWPVDLPTISVLNRCIPRQQKVESDLVLCAKPTCHEAHKPCLTTSGFGIPRDAWMMSSDAEDASLCNAQITLDRTATTQQPGAGPYLSYLFSISNLVEDVNLTLQDNWMRILAFGIGLSTLVNFFWMVLLFFFAGCAVYVALYLLQILLFVLSLLSFIKAGVFSHYVQSALNHTSTFIASANMSSIGVDIGMDSVSGITAQASDFLATDATYASYYMWAGWTLLIVFILLEILLCVAKKNIQITIALVSEATQAMRNSKAMIFLPVMISALQLLVLSFCFVVMLYISVLGSGTAYDTELANMEKSYLDTALVVDHYAESLGAPAGLISNISAALDITTVSKSDEQIFMGIYVAVGFVWTYYTLNAIGLICISANVFYFFFVDKDTVDPAVYDKQYDDNQTEWPVMVYLGYTLRFHVGTAAFGALILTFITALQAATKAVFESMKKAQGEGNMIKVVEVCVNCFLWCFKKSIEFINSYAYVYVFIENENFCTACAHTFGLIKDNPTQIAINKIVQSMLVLLQSCTTPLLCSFVTYETFDLLPHSDKSSASLGSLIVTAAVFVLSFLMTKAFAQVYEQVVQSLTVCVLHDIKNWGGMYVRKSLREAFDLEPISSSGYSGGAKSSSTEMM
mmetsp:Transcript_4741/g.9832  ORF Transcript_4741/g.9832 Transcript_4741/m.9832 type:complete len:750 (+) Transcript_4741:28-2277(+)